MKRFVSFCLAFLCLFGFVGCQSEGNPVAEALAAVKEMDVARFSRNITLDGKTDLDRMVMNDELLDESDVLAMKALYSLMHFTIDAPKDEDGKRTVAVKAKMPDMARVRSLAASEVVVLAKTAAEVVSEMIDSGKIEGGMMLEYTWEIVLEKTGELWYISYNDPANKSFFEALYFAEMILFFAKN